MHKHSWPKVSWPKVSWQLSVVLFLALVGWLLLTQSLVANSVLMTTRYVAADGNCGTNAPCYGKLQAAVDAANDGDLLLVAAGSYTGVDERNGSTQLLYLDKSIVIRGGYHPETWIQDPAANPTILDAGGGGHVLFINGDVAPVVDGFHLINGSAGNGGGVYVETAAITLSRNEIYRNWAEGRGGGIYLKDSAATIASNHIYTNTTGASGRGGGLALADSPATVEGNLIEDNRAHVGAGIEMNNNLGEGGALLIGNTIRDNIALNTEQDGRTFAGAGGGIDTHSYLTDTLRNNIVSGNVAQWGGGVHAFGAATIMVENTIQGNEAPIHGGGLYVQGGYLSLESNDILSNTAGSWGGGLTLLVNSALVRGNTFQGNTAGWRGGGMYASSGAQFDGNLFLGNTAVEQGGGAFLIQDNGAVYQNTVFVGNQAAEGGGLYIWAGNARLIHSTIANNTSGDGRAVVIDKYPGLVNPDETPQYPATVVFTNTIVAGQPVGFFATADNKLTVDGVLWWETPTHVQADGADVTVLNEHTGDPSFQADGYHLRTYSAARDKGRSALEHDVDGHLRDGGDQKDLGADEHVPMVVIEPDVGGTLTYTNAQEGITITLDVPPDAVTKTVVIQLSPFPPLPPDVLNSPFGSFVAVGPPFRLDVFSFVVTAPVTDPVDPPIEDVSDISDAVIFEHYPAHLIAEVGLEKLKLYRKKMDEMELALLTLLTIPSPPLDPACGPGLVDLEQRILDVPICDTGIIPEAVQPAAVPSVRLLAVEPNAKSGYFLFVFEIEKTRTFLPLITR